MQSLLELLRRGPQSPAAIREALGISGATLSRKTREAGERIVSVGKSRSLVWYAVRPVRLVSEFPVYQVSAQGRLRCLGGLVPVWPHGYVMRYDDDTQVYSEGLPWWMMDIRPEGFLGRAWAKRRSATLRLSDELSLWADDDVLWALSAGEADVPGNLIIGEESRDAWLSSAEVAYSRQEMAEVFPRLAAQAVAGEVPGSSAGGEQPKFATTLDGTPVIVKFTASQDSPVAERWRDLLLAEHCALSVLASHGMATSRTEIVDVGLQRFLVIERFDREPVASRGRHGLVLLRSLDAEFVGRANEAWPDITARLMAALSPRLRSPVITEEAHAMACRLHAFGRLIGNTDMHLGNLAFYHDGDLPLALAPAYDMLPMRLSPAASGNMANEIEPVAPPLRVDVMYWREMLPLARRFWQQLADDSRCSAAFARIAVAQQSRLDAAEALFDRFG